MKKTIFLFAIALIASAFVTKDHSVTFNISTENSTVEWKGTKVTGEHTGTINIKSGTFTVDHGTITGGKIELDMTSITDTDMEGEGKEKLEGHLKSEDFFSVAKHPAATFVLKKAEQKEGKNYTVTGDLTIKDITHEIVFPAIIEMDETKFAAYAEFKIDRTKWDIKYGSGKFFEGLGDKMIYDDIELKFKIGATANQ
ncbi:MAG: lipid-binding protein [Flavobacteriales bacterium]|nr:MAG: lipid-binding protein [Flavobacteriales bacterium]